MWTKTATAGLWAVTLPCSSAFPTKIWGTMTQLVNVGLAWIHRLVGRLSWSWSDRSCGVPVGAFWVKVRVWMGSLRLVGPVEAIASVVVGEFGQAEAGVRPRSVSWAPAVR